MERNYYMTNRQLLLFMVKELHKRGYENLRIIPSLSPSGMSWRCEFFDGRTDLMTASTWLTNYETESSRKIKLTVAQLADNFERDNRVFVEACKVENAEYVSWYSQMVDSLKKDELPYAYAEYFSPTDYWKTSNGRKISILPDDARFIYRMVYRQ